MARIQEPTPEQEAAWKEWVASRPEAVRLVAERFEPWSLYRLKSSGRYVTLYSFGEEEGGEVTLTVDVEAGFNLVTFERRVFGIKPDDLESCELPASDEPVGALLTEDGEIQEYIDTIRPMVVNH